MDSEGRGGGAVGLKELGSPGGGAIEKWLIGGGGAIDGAPYEDPYEDAIGGT